MRVAAAVYFDVIAGGLHPVDVLGPQKEDAASRLHDEAVGVMTLLLQRFQERQDALVERRRRRATQLRPGAIERRLEARLVERLEQKVQRMHLEGAEGMAIVGGHEDHRR